MVRGSANRLLGSVSVEFQVTFSPKLMEELQTENYAALILIVSPEDGIFARSNLYFRLDELRIAFNLLINPRAASGQTKAPDRQPATVRFRHLSDPPSSLRAPGLA
jgi:hypothetical protein